MKNLKRNWTMKAASMVINVGSLFDRGVRSAQRGRHRDNPCRHWGAGDRRLDHRSHRAEYHESEPDKERYLGGDGRLHSHRGGSEPLPGLRQPGRSFAL